LRPGGLIIAQRSVITMGRTRIGVINSSDGGCHNRQTLVALRTVVGQRQETAQDGGGGGRLTAGAYG